MENSIRNNLSKSDIISTIRMSMAADIKNEMTFIIVEGYDDVAFMRNKIAENSTILESFSGKEGVREIVEFFNNINVIGICDRDYDYAYQNNMVFHYDFSCLEMMMIKNDNVFNQYQVNFIMVILIQSF